VGGVSPSAPVLLRTLQRPVGASAAAPSSGAQGGLVVSGDESFALVGTPEGDTSPGALSDVLHFTLGTGASLSLRTALAGALGGGLASMYWGEAMGMDALGGGGAVAALASTPPRSAIDALLDANSDDRSFCKAAVVFVPASGEQWSAYELSVPEGAAFLSSEADAAKKKAAMARCAVRDVHVVTTAPEANEVMVVAASNAACKITYPEMVLAGDGSGVATGVAAADQAAGQVVDQVIDICETVKAFSAFGDKVPEKAGTAVNSDGTVLAIFAHVKDDAGVAAPLSLLFVYRRLARRFGLVHVVDVSRVAGPGAAALDIGEDEAVSVSLNDLGDICRVGVDSGSILVNTGSGEND